MLKSILKLISVIFLIISLISCSESIVESTPSIVDNIEQGNVAPKFSEIQNEIFNKSCALSGCHVSGAVSPDLSGNSHSRIVSKSSSTGMNFIEPDKPNDSYLLLKIIGTNINGSRMPLNSSPLSQEQVGAITEWINNGAQND